MQANLPEIIKYCQHQQITLTSQQELILAAVIAHQNPVTANEILLKLKESNPKANRMTIHRGLEYLVKANLIHRVSFNLTYKLCNHLHHGHHCQILVCQSCGKQTELHSEAIQEALNTASKLCQFKISNPIEITGFCHNCQT